MQLIKGIQSPQGMQLIKGIQSPQVTQSISVSPQFPNQKPPKTKTLLNALIKRTGGGIKEIEQFTVNEN